MIRVSLGDGVPVSLEALAEAAARVLTYPPEKLEALARRSALWTVERHPGCDVADVVREQGMAEENARRAITQLVAMGRVRLRSIGGYEAIGGAS